MRRMAIALLAASLVACSNNDNVVAPLQTVTGDWVLVSINGSALPFVFSDGSSLTSDVLTLFDDGTFSESMQFAGGQVFVDQGTFIVNNNAIRFTDLTAGFSYSGSISGTTLTAIFPNGLTEVFQRR